MKLQLSVCDDVLQIRQESIPSMFVQVNALQHKAQLPDKKKHASLVSSRLHFPTRPRAKIRSITFIDQLERDRKILQHR